MKLGTFKDTVKNGYIVRSGEEIGIGYKAAVVAIKNGDDFDTVDEPMPAWRTERESAIDAAIEAYEQTA